MARFLVDNRVMIPQFHSQAPSFLWDKVGIVTLIGPPIRWVAGEDSGQPVERQYVVRFDGSQEDEMVWENWLEPAPPDQQ